MAALAAGTTSSEATRTAVQELSNKVAERYLTRQEDEQRDQEIRDEIYRWAREQFKLEQERANEAHAAFLAQIKDLSHRLDRTASKSSIGVLQWMVGLETFGIFSLIGVIVATLLNHA